MLYALQPLNQSITPRGGQRNMASEQGATGRNWGAAPPREEEARGGGVGRFETYLGNTKI